jgi:hypothetical protein
VRQKRRQGPTIRGPDAINALDPSCLAVRTPAASRYFSERIRTGRDWARPILARRVGLDGLVSNSTVSWRLDQTESTARWSAFQSACGRVTREFIRSPCESDIGGVSIVVRSLARTQPTRPSAYATLPAMCLAWPTSALSTCPKFGLILSALAALASFTHRTRRRAVRGENPLLGGSNAVVRIRALGQCKFDQPNSGPS